MNKYVKKELDFAGRKLTLETGKVAMQSNMAVWARYGDTVVLATVVSSKPKAESDGLPLTCKYEEKLYAGGLIKSSRWVKREGAPTEQAIIAGRLIDHAVRPLFPKDFQDEVTVSATVLSIDRDADPEVLAMIASSAALHASDIPWNGPMVTARLSMDTEGKFVINPKEQSIDESQLDLMVSLTNGKFLAMEARANIVPEEKIVEAVMYVDQETKPLHDLIEDFAKEVGKEKYVYESKTLPKEMVTEIKGLVGSKIRDLMAKNLDKAEMSPLRDALLEEVFATYDGKYSKMDMIKSFMKIETDAMRHMVLEEKKRADGRGVEEVRPIKVELGVLPRTHGSAIFSRGVTQTLTVVTLGSPSLEQLVQSMYGEETKRYMHHYNMPEYASGETSRGRGGGPKAREIGHGMLAEKALYPVLPDKNVFPYTIRLVTEVLSSSGSTSMAATCGSSLALMDAGVPIKAPVAGIAVGIITNEDESEYVLITDVAYLEDAYGFMDFKMTGTREGISAIQVDIKLPGVPLRLLPDIVAQSKRARISILDIMDSHIPKARIEVSTYAPKVLSMQVKPEQIGIIIGSGGKTIREIEAKTGSTLNIEEDGTVTISGPTRDSMEKAKLIVDGMTRLISPGDIFEGTVKRILDFGAFVEILPGKEGLVHISELSHRYVGSVRDVVKEGDTFPVKVIEVDQMGRINLSKKAMEPNDNPEGEQAEHRPPMGDRGAGGSSMGRRPYGGGGRGGFGGSRSGGGGRGGFSRDRGSRDDYRSRR